MDSQTRTNSSGWSGVKASRFQRPDFFVTKTCRHKSELSSLIPKVIPLRPLNTDGRVSIVRISRAGMTMVWKRIHACSSSRSGKIRYCCHKLAGVRRETKTGCSKALTEIFLDHAPLNAEAQTGPRQDGQDFLTRRQPAFSSFELFLSSRILRSRSSSSNKAFRRRLMPVI